MKSTSSARVRTGFGSYFSFRHLEQHVQEVAGEAEVVVRVDVRPADAVAVGVGGDARHLRDQAMHLPEPRLLVEDVLGIGIEGGQRADGAEEDPHRVRVVAEALHELLDVLVEHRVERDLLRPVLQLRGRRQLAEENQVGRFEVVAFFGQLLDRIAAIEQDALVAVDVGDRAAAVRGVHERRVVRHQPEVVGRRLDLPEVHRADGAVLIGSSYFLPVRLSVIVSVSAIRFSSGSIMTGSAGTRYDSSAHRARSCNLHRSLQNGRQAGSTGCRRQKTHNSTVFTSCGCSGPVISACCSRKL